MSLAKLRRGEMLLRMIARLDGRVGPRGEAVDNRLDRPLIFGRLFDDLLPLRVAAGEIGTTQLGRLLAVQRPVPLSGQAKTRMAAPSTIAVRDAGQDREQVSGRVIILGSMADRRAGSKYRRCDVCTKISQTGNAPAGPGTMYSWSPAERRNGN